MVVCSVIWRLYGQLRHGVYPFAIGFVAFWGLNVVFGQIELMNENQFRAGS